MSKDKLKFSHRVVSLPSLGIKGAVMSGTDELVVHATAGGPGYPTNKNLYRILNLPWGRFICSAMTQKNARTVIERLHSMNFNWSEVGAQGSEESQRLKNEVEAMRREGIIC
jgi:hypothetical protein